MPDFLGWVDLLTLRAPELRYNPSGLVHAKPFGGINRDLKIQDGREGDGAPKDNKDWA